MIFWNEEKKLPQKCTFCAHLLDKGWKEPRCVEACPTRALVFGDLHDPDSEVAKLVASGRTEALHPGYDLGDKVRYIGLPKRFIAGAVVYGDTDRCGEGAEVTLRKRTPGHRRRRRCEASRWPTTTAISTSRAWQEGGTTGS